jgi:negative regulator of flagellin synthesis FlgM
VIVKISGGGSVKPTSPTSTQEIVSGKAPTTPQGAVTSAHGDNVELSEGSSLLQKVEEALSNVSVVDASRVEEVKQAISEGRFRVDSSVVADQLLVAVREHLLTHKQ